MSIVFCWLVALPESLTAMVSSVWCVLVRVMSVRAGVVGKSGTVLNGIPPGRLKGVLRSSSIKKI